jgi:triosephosphate isomerase (TIM)
MASERKIVAGNWKMNPATVTDAKKTFNALAKAVMLTRGVEIIVCPPAAFLAPLREVYKGKKIAFGAQTVHAEEKGAKTGETAASMVKSLGATYTIVGHSERRAMGETNEDVGKKLLRSTEVGMSPILCVGEHKRDVSGNHFFFIREQIRSALQVLPRPAISSLIVAYEPVWAIGKSAKDAMKPADVHEMVIFIRKTVAESAGFASASALPILYGGSVEPANAAMLMREGFVSGFLVGHASLVPTDFATIIEAVAEQ